MKYGKAFLLWLIFLIVAVISGMLRESLLIPALGAPTGRAVGTLLVGVVILGLIFLYVVRLKNLDTRDLLKLGIFWTVLTIAFECLFGHYVMGASWEFLLADYNVRQGRLWPLVLLVTLLGPILADKMRNWFHV